MGERHSCAQSPGEAEHSKQSTGPSHTPSALKTSFLLHGYPFMVHRCYPKKVLAWCGILTIQMSLLVCPSLSARGM
jgi:hypothetical protein